MSMQISLFGVLIIAAYSAIVLLLLVGLVARVHKESRLTWRLLAS